MEIHDEENHEKEQDQGTKEIIEYSPDSSPRSSTSSDETFSDIATLVDFYTEGGESSGSESDDEDIYDKQMKIWDETLWVLRDRASTEQEVIKVDWKTFL